jgi:branched-chain amino acid transport system permease protein
MVGLEQAPAQPWQKVGLIMPVQIVMQALVSGLLLGFIYSLVAVGMSLIWGVMGFVNFAHADFMMLSMYASYWMYALWGLDPVLSLPLVVGLMFVAGVVTYKGIISRVVGSSILVQLFVGFGLMIAFRGFAQFLWSPDFRTIPDTLISGRLQAFGLYLSIPQVLAGLGAVVLDAVLFWFIQRTETGRKLRAVAEDRVAAALMGIDSERMYALAWGIAVACAGAAGGLIISYYYVYPDVGAIFGVMALIIVSMAGFGNILGTLLTSMICGVVVSLGGVFINPAFKFAIVFVFYLVFMVARRSRE